MSNVLTELLPRKARLTLYAIVFVAGAALAAWAAANGDWLLFAAGLLKVLGGAFAGSNLNPPLTDLSQPGEGVNL